MDHYLDSKPGTYALLIGLEAPTEIEIGRLGRISFDSPYYLYFGSAFGPGGLRARVNHHLQSAARPHWHIDYLRRVAEVQRVWYSDDPDRLECAWSRAASSFRGASSVPRFGSSDCDCDSHLLAISRQPGLPCFRRHVNRIRPGCASIRQLRVVHPHAA